MEHTKNLNQALKVAVPGLLAFLYLSRIIDGNTAEAEKHAYVANEFKTLVLIAFKYSIASS